MSTFLFMSLFLLLGQNDQKNKPEVVSDVNLSRYSGKWYEIARLPNHFERKLKCITATYTVRNDGKITVLNKGHSVTEPARTSSAKGVAWLPDKSVQAKLKVRFFWPFSGNYWIIYLEKDYRYVLIGEPSFKYLWILSREKTIEDSVYRMLLQKAKENGYNVGQIIRVDQNCE